MNTAIRNLIREEKTYQIDSAIASNGAVGMQTMDQALFNAVREGKVAKDVALQYSHHQESSCAASRPRACKARRVPVRGPANRIQDRKRPPATAGGRFCRALKAEHEKGPPKRALFMQGL